MGEKNNIILLLLCMLLGSNPLFSQKNISDFFDIDLWEQGMPNTNGMDMLPLDDSKHNYKPSIRVFLPDSTTANGRAVIACPGGAYSHLAYTKEGSDWAPFFSGMGIALIVLKYRMPNGNNEVPFSDAEEAIRLVKENAEKWKINPDDIGIMGFSAGGHLASTVATHIKAALRPHFQILFYPVITMDKAYTHPGSHNNLLGKDASKELEDEYSNEKRVNMDTPRAFIVFSDDDPTVSPLNGVNYYSALKKNRVPASLHIYPSGKHGWGMRDSFLYKSEMLAELTAWLRSF